MGNATGGSATGGFGGGSGAGGVSGGFSAGAGASIHPERRHARRIATLTWTLPSTTRFAKWRVGWATRAGIRAARRALGGRRIEACREWRSHRELHRILIHLDVLGRDFSGLDVAEAARAFSNAFEEKLRQHGLLSQA